MNNHLLQDLNPQQAEAVQHIAGPLLIVAGPGSGKTRVIVHRIAYLVRSAGINPQRIAAVTFTNKAAREMKDRLVRLLGAEAQPLTMGTFHATFSMLLRREGTAIGLEPNFTIYDTDDQLKLIKQTQEDMDLDLKRYNPNAILSIISGAKSRLLTPEAYRSHVTNNRDDVARRVYEQYQERLDRNNAVDFDDLLLKTYLLFINHPDVLSRWQDRYQHLMVDEFQDTNVAQYILARQLAGKHRNICVVGDPDQSIYGWRNADIGNILSFEKDYPDARKVSLSQNYRSTKTLVEAAQAVIQANHQRIQTHLTTYNPPGSPVIIHESYNEEEEAQFVLRNIHELIFPSSSSESSLYRYQDIAVMYRTNAQSRALEDACFRLGVPYKLVGGVRFYHRREVKDLLAYLRVIYNPNDDLSLIRIINVPPRGIGLTTQDRLINLAQQHNISLFDELVNLEQEHGHADSSLWANRTQKALTGFSHLIQNLRKMSSELPVAQLIDAIIKHSGLQTYLQPTQREEEERLENLREVQNIAEDFNLMEPTEGLASFLERVSLVAEIDQLEQEQQGITLITLHQAKGLEFSVVFITGLEEGLLPHIRSIESEDPNQIEEERRLCYVGITRAKEQLYLTRAFRRGFRGHDQARDPSRFLADLPSALRTTQRTSNEKALQANRRRPDPRINVESPTRSSTAKPSLKVGDKVRHAKFGEGIVFSCSPTTDDLVIEVAFARNQGVRKFILGSTPIEKIE